MTVAESPSRSRTRLSATAAQPAMFQAELRRLDAADLGVLHGLCVAAGVRDSRDLPSLVGVSC